MSIIPGMNILLMGAPGSGKTYSLRTLVSPEMTLLLGRPLNVFVIFMEQSMSILGDHENLSWRYIPPSAPSWEDMISSAKMINKFDNATLQKLHGINKSSFTQFIDVLSSLHEWTDPLKQRSYGSVTRFGTDSVVVIDPLTSLGKASMSLATGSKPIKTEPDWGVAMDTLQKLVDKLCLDTFCHFILLAHIEREQDPVNLQSRIYVSTLGRKLAPVLPNHFSDVIFAYREGTNFHWSTANGQCDLKTRHLEMKDKLPASFVPLFKGWLKTGGQLINHVPEEWMLVQKEAAAQKR